MPLMILGGIAALFAVFLVFVATRSPHYEISREIAIAAPPEKVFPYLNGSRLADAWMPWKEIDPASRNTFSGPESGVGARTSWEGGKQMGVGSAEITASEANRRVEIKLEYVKPMAMKQVAEYLLRPEGSGSVVVWRVTGKNTFAGRLFCFFVNMDKMVGGSFEKGLANLKRITEAR